METINYSRYPKEVQYVAKQHKRISEVTLDVLGMLANDTRPQLICQVLGITLDKVYQSKNLYPDILKAYHRKELDGTPIRITPEQYAEAGIEIEKPKEEKPMENPTEKPIEKSIENPAHEHPEYYTRKEANDLLEAIKFSVDSLFKAIGEIKHELTATVKESELDILSQFPKLPVYVPESDPKAEMKGKLLDYLLNEVIGK